MKIQLILVRIYVNDLDPAIDFYERLTGEKCANRFEYKQANLEIARVSNFLIIAGSDEALKPFRDTAATILVDSVSEYKEFLMNNGGATIRDIQQVPTGLNMTIKHEDGAVFEYVEFR